jgi:hypothetical protein
MISREALHRNLPTTCVLMRSSLAYMPRTIARDHRPEAAQN